MSYMKITDLRNMLLQYMKGKSYNYDVRGKSFGDNNTSQTCYCSNLKKHLANVHEGHKT